MTPSGVKVAFLRYCSNLTTCAGAHVVIFYMLISEIRLNTEIRVFHSISMFFFQLNKMIFYTYVKIYLFIGRGGRVFMQVYRIKTLLDVSLRHLKRFSETQCCSFLYRYFVGNKAIGRISKPR